MMISKMSSVKLNKLDSFYILFSSWLKVQGDKNSTEILCTGERKWKCTDASEQLCHFYVIILLTTDTAKKIKFKLQHYKEKQNPASVIHATMCSEL